MKKTYLWITLALGFVLAAAPAQAEGPLDFGGYADWAYTQVKERGVMGVRWNWRGDSRMLVAMNYGLFHNKYEKKEDRKDYVAIAIGIDTPLIEDDDPEGGKKKNPFSEANFHIAVPINVLALGGRLWTSEWFQDHVSVATLPTGIELWAGPIARIPTRNFKSWRFDTDTGAYISLGKRFGGAKIIEPVFKKPGS